MRFPCLDSEENAKPPVVCHAGIGHVGGGSPRGISWTSIERFVKSTPEIFDNRSMLPLRKALQTLHGPLLPCLIKASLR
jgi:hypothetical protein